MSKNLGIAYSMKRKKMAKGGKMKLSKNHQENEPLYESDQGSSKQGAKVRSANRSKSWANDDRSSSPKIERSMAKDRMGEARQVASSRAEAERAVKPRLQGLASGGNVESSIIKPRRIDAMGRDKDAMDAINNLVPMEDAEEDMAMHPAHLEDDNDEMGEKDAMDDHMEMLAEGGMAEADSIDEEELEHASSLAAAIMAKRKFAKGGEVDLDMNAEEEPNNEDDMSFEALKKENYDEADALDAADQPDDSNEHSPEHDEEDVDDKNMVSAIRRKMKHKSAMTK